MKNYYKILGISQNCSKEEIKKAFRELAVKYHPDKNTDERFAEHFKEINEAKQVLLDDFKKFQYDISFGHFLSEKSVFSLWKNRKRKSRRRSYALAIIRETVTNKFFLGFLFTISVLLTIAFLTIPAAEQTLYSERPKKGVRTNEKKVLSIEPVLAVPKVVNIETKNAGFVSTNAIREAKLKTTTRKAYKIKSRVKKHAFSTRAHTTKRTGRNKKLPVKIKSIPPPATTPVAIGNKKRLIALNHSQMIAILHQVKAEQKKVGSNSNCVQIIKSQTSNISNAFVLAHFLQGYGYIISGREKIGTDSKGIMIDATKDCIMITIGVLPQP